MAHGGMPIDAFRDLMLGQQQAPRGHTQSDLPNPSSGNPFRNGGTQHSRHSSNSPAPSAFPPTASATRPRRDEWYEDQDRIGGVVATERNLNPFAGGNPQARTVRRHEESGYPRVVAISRHKTPPDTPSSTHSHSMTSSGPYEAYKSGSRSGERSDYVDRQGGGYHGGDRLRPTVSMPDRANQADRTSPQPKNGDHGRLRAMGEMHGYGRTPVEVFSPPTPPGSGPEQDRGRRGSRQGRVSEEEQEHRLNQDPSRNQHQYYNGPDFRDYEYPASEFGRGRGYEDGFERDQDRDWDRERFERNQYYADRDRDARDRYNFGYDTRPAYAQEPRYNQRQHYSQRPLYEANYEGGPDYDRRPPYDHDSRYGLSPGYGRGLDHSPNPRLGRDQHRGSSPDFGQSSGMNRPSPRHWAEDEMAATLDPTRPEKSLSSLLLGMSEMNILILGETGVGKSTFVNALVNYLTYDSLETAVNLREVACVIPSNFTWQSLKGNDFVAKHISVKPNTGNHQNDTAVKDEHHSQDGQSATQKPKVYEVKVGQTTVRLIDTPGIGDTRGSTQDKKNMDEIIKNLSQVKELHGILILLKPNNARLNLMFKFCLNELLVHLDRDAAKNIVFGFTNARNTNFLPGETYMVLKQMLNDDQSTGITMSRDISYCFDSESFRCLAAHENGVDLDDLGDMNNYKISWDKSAEETYRLLEHFKSIKGHNANKTRDLHQTRELVRILTRPMADITQTINNNISLLEDEKLKVEDNIRRGRDLKDSLTLQKVEFKVKQLDKPRTVCADPQCVEYKDNQAVYKVVCHAECHVQGIECDKIKCVGLMQCLAFGCGQSSTCLKCEHSWQVHLHVLFDTYEETVQVEDEAVKQRMRENASDTEIAHTAIQSRQKMISELEGERDVIQKAAAQFSVYLKNSSIKQYNDSKLDYLDHLIQEERGKVQAGGKRKRLDELLADRNQHVEEVRTLTDLTKKGTNHKPLNQSEITALINDLYNLPHYGKNLRVVAKKMADIETSANHQALVAARRQPLLQHSKPGINNRTSMFGNNFSWGGALKHIV